MNRIIKKVICLGMVLFFTAISVFCFSQRVYAEDIDLNEIMDDSFRQYILSSYDADHNGKISEAEAADVKKIDIRNKGIKSLDGISMFPNLEELNCVNNEITSLDMSGNPKLRSLICEENDIGYLNVANNKELSVLNCALNDLDGIDVSNNTKLTDLQCAGNKNFGNIDLSNNTELVSLLYVVGSMDEIDLSNNTKLKSLWISTTPLKELDLRANKELTVIFCNATDIATIDLRNNTGLQENSVNVMGNRLISIHTSSGIGSNIDTDKQRELHITVPAGKTSYDLRNIDPDILAEDITDLNGAVMEGTVVKDIYDGMKISYIYTENNVNLHAAIVFHADETKPVDPSDPSDNQETVAEEKTDPSDEKVVKTDKAVPDTGDERRLYFPAIILMMLTAAGICAAAFARRK